MTQHMQSSLPAHLRQQMGSGAHMSAQTQRAIMNHMEKTMPSHLKQYAGAFMEQQVRNPGLTVTPGASSSHAPAPMPERMRMDHSNVSAAQYEAAFHNDLFSADAGTPPPQGQPVAPEPPQPAEIPPTGPVQPDYGFIVEPPKPPRRGPQLPSLSGDTPPAIKIVAAVGGLLFIIIVFALAKSLFSGGGNKQALTTVAQDQQSMIHILTNGPGNDSQQQATLSDDTLNFSATAQASLSSDQQQLIDYMAANHMKLSTKSLSLKINPTIDQQLTTAASNNAYEPVFRQVMHTQLLNYEQALQAAYKQTSGPKGRALLSQDFKSAQLLLKELGPSS